MRVRAVLVRGESKAERTENVATIAPWAAWLEGQGFELVEWVWLDERKEVPRAQA